MKMYPLSFVRGRFTRCLRERCGKSTSMKVLFGLEALIRARLFLRDSRQRSNLHRTRSARGSVWSISISCWYLHLRLPRTLSWELRLRKACSLIWTRQVKAAEDIAKEYNFDIDVRQKVEEIPVGIKQKVEILKALYRGAEILILDEPTAY